MKKIILAVALSLAWHSNAGPLDPNLAIDEAGDFINGSACGAFSCIAGEGAAPNTLIGKKLLGIISIPDTAVQHLDWIVVHDNNNKGGYTYYYQLENSSIAALGAVTVANDGTGIFASGSGFTAKGIDLDSANALTTVGHDVATFANLLAPRTDLTVGPHNGLLKPEFEFAEQELLIGPTAAVVDFNSDLLAVFALGLPSDAESGIYGAQGAAPVYGAWNTQGAAFTWNSENANPCTGPVNAGCEQGVRVPVPGVPEPGSLLLFGAGLLGLGFWARRYRS